MDSTLNQGVAARHTVHKQMIKLMNLSEYTLNPAPSTEAQAIDIALRLERHVKQ